MESPNSGTHGRPASRASRKGARIHFLCSECGDSFPQWYGRCPSCQTWASLHEFREPAAPAEGGRTAGGALLGPGSAAPGARPGRTPADSRATASAGRLIPDPDSRRAAGGDVTGPGASGAIALGDVPVEQTPRLACGIDEFDRAIGGGLVSGSVVLLGGDPGIGKSTLLLQVASALVTRGARVLYVSGEESASQVRIRAQRLAGISGDLQILPETNLEAVVSAVEALAPNVVVIDSIQTAYLPAVGSAPGSLSQVRESALALLSLAKSRGMTVLLVGHVTKEGTLAGPKTLEHMVDTVLYLEGERYQHYRILRSVKNRFGGVHEIGVFEMAEDGMREVPNPSQVFLSEHTAGAVGSIVVASVEGTRAVLMEVQALVHGTRYGMPQRVSTGYDARRLEIILAVLAKRGGVDTSKHDVFVNVAGGLRVDEPGVDLGVLLAVASSCRERPPHPDMVVLGEIGLGGEVRRIAHPGPRLTEAARLGYNTVLLPRANARDLDEARNGIRLIGVSAVAEALHEGLQSGPRPGARAGTGLEENA